jgi:hypothetical protein
VQPLLGIMRDIGGAHGGKTPGQVRSISSGCCIWEQWFTQKLYVVILHIGWRPGQQVAWPAGLPPRCCAPRRRNGASNAPADGSLSASLLAPVLHGQLDSWTLCCLDSAC